MPQAAQAYDGNLLTFLHIPARQRRVRGDTGAEQGCRYVEVECIGDVQNEVLVHHDFFGVAALGDGVINVGGIIGPHATIEAVLLHSGLALLALAAGIDQAAHADAVPHLELSDLLPHSGDHAGDLMADGQRKVRFAPLVADGVDIRVADSCGLNVDDDVIGARLAALDGHDLEGLVRAGLLQGFSRNSHGDHGTPQPPDLA